MTSGSNTNAKRSSLWRLMPGNHRACNNQRPILCLALRCLRDCSTRLDASLWPGFASPWVNGEGLCYAAGSVFGSIPLIPQKRGMNGIETVAVQCADYFLGGAMVSLATLATRNFTTVLALILMGSPVWGLRPMRALRSALTSLPMPGMVNSPFFL